MQTDRFSAPLPRFMTRAAALASTAAFAALMVGMPLLLGASRNTLPISPIEDATPDATIDAGTEPLKEFARLRMKCAGCGSIESIRETDNESEASEITIRLQDGSSRVMIDANPGGLRPGQRVKVIEGLAGPGA
jgi:hypothetical protein